MEQVKSDFNESVIEESSHLMREKFKRGHEEHNQSLDDVRNLDEMVHEAIDVIWYAHNHKRLMQKLLDLIEEGDYYTAKLLIRGQL